VFAPGEPAEEAARGQERRRQVRVEGRAPALEAELQDRLVRLRPDAGDRRAGVERTRLGEEPLHLVLARQVGPDERATRLVRQRLGPFLPAVPVADDLRSLGREGAHARGADPAGGAGDEDARAGEARLHVKKP